jgi:hypothetical protein
MHTDRHFHGCAANLVIRGLTPASYILFLGFLSVFGSRDGQYVSIYGCMSIDILILVYRLYTPMFSVLSATVTFYRSNQCTLSDYPYVQPLKPIRLESRLNLALN